MRDSVKIAELLLNKEFPIDQDDEVLSVTKLCITYPYTQNGETALHVTYKKGSHQVWRLLLNEGANPSKKNKVSIT